MKEGFSMGMFSSPVAEVTIDFYGQKRRNKAISNVQIFYSIHMNPYMMDPRILANFYGNCFFKLVDIEVLPTNRELFWEFVNASFSNIGTNSSNIFYIWQGFLDVPPLPGIGQGKVNTSIKMQLLDNGKTSFKMSEGAVDIYYVPIAAVALMQHVISNLSPGDFNIFCLEFNNYAYSKKMSIKKMTPYNYDLHELPLLGSAQQMNTQVMYEQQVITQPVNIQPEVPQSGVIKRFCGNCGEQYLIGIHGETPKFCGSCGNAL